jgi:predicted Ser/Thr protein kinase
VDVPDPVSRQWIDEMVVGLSDQAVLDVVTRLRARGGEQAQLAERLLRLRGDVVPVVGEATGGRLSETVLGETVIARAPVDPEGAPEAGDLGGGGRFAGYVVEGVAGRGGMGVVYRARQLRPSRVVGLKVISPELAGDGAFRERFTRESEVAASIEHSNVIPVYEVGEDGGRLFIAMRFVAGTDLAKVIATGGRVEPRRAVGILAQLTSALDAAHARGLVHRDVKPANVLIAREGDGDHVYLTDFGLARFAVDGGLTRTGTFVGTIDFAAPEQFQGRRVDARTDVYAAGCVLFTMLTGRVPFPREDDAAVMWAHVSSPPPSVGEVMPGLPNEFDAVVARAMAKDPDQRYPSAGDLGRDALAAAERQRASLSERSVATGKAAPAGAPAAPAGAPTAPAGAPTAPAGAPTAPSTAPAAPAIAPAAPGTAPAAPGTAQAAPAGAQVGPPSTQADPTRTQAGPRGGQAGPSGGQAGPPGGGRSADPPGKPRPRALIPALAAASLAVVVVLALVVTGAFSSSHSPKIITTTSAATTSSTKVTTPKPVPPPAPTTKTFTDLKHGISFTYPVAWERLRLSGVLADFGINPGRSETRCALVFEPGAGPASGSQEAQLAYVRTRSAVAASEAKHYQVLAIEAQQGANISGVGLLRTDNGQGGHIGFFFRGRNIYVFDCITPAAQLTQVDQQDFQPLLASVRIG